MLGISFMILKCGFTGAFVLILLIVIDMRWKKLSHRRLQKEDGICHETKNLE